MQQSLYRIIDVNFNRAREAARVMEEFARFVLDSASLSSKAKELRHRLSRLVSTLDQTRLIMSRNSRDDVGLGLKVDGQLTRKNTQDVFLAAAKRLPEALRTLSETIQTLDPELAAGIEELRFKAYDLERDIVIRLDVASLYENVRLYVLLDTDLPDKFESLAQQCIEGGADCLQLRCKNCDDGVKYDFACKLIDICRGTNVVAIINDSVDIALASGAHGVHLGQDDMPFRAARSLYTRPMLTGISTHNLTQLERAIYLGADYVGIGPAFATKTKPGIELAGLDYVRQAVSMLEGTGIGHAVIGGIDESNISEVVEAGARTVAVHSAVTASDDPAGVCRRLKEKLIG
jgi:thiamine-phosphate pyrophosphorylase